jgi:hypothetical protein
MEQMRTSMVLPESLASWRFDMHNDFFVLSEPTAFDPDTMNEHPIPAIIRIEQTPNPVTSENRPHVSDLAARLRIRGRAIENHFDLGTLRRFRQPPGPIVWQHHRKDLAWLIEGLVADEIARGRLGRDHAVEFVRSRVIGLVRRSPPRPRNLLVCTVLFGIPDLVDSSAALGDEIADQFEWHPERGKQGEGILARNEKRPAQDSASSRRNPRSITCSKSVLSSVIASWMCWRFSTSRG